MDLNQSTTISNYCNNVLNPEIQAINNIFNIISIPKNNETIQIQQLKDNISTPIIKTNTDIYILADNVRAINRNAHVMEPQGEISGMMVDIDIEQMKYERVLTKTLCENLTNRFAAILNKYLDMQQTTTLRIFVLGRPNPVRNKKDSNMPYRDGIHLLIPELQITSAVKNFIFDKYRPLFENVMVRIENINNILDRMCTQVPVFLYGCGKPNYEPYKVLYIHEYQFDVDIHNRIDIPITTLNGIPSIAAELSINGLAPRTWLSVSTFNVQSQYLNDIEQINKNLIETNKECSVGGEEILKKIKLDANLQRVNIEGKLCSDLLKLLPDEYIICGKKWWGVMRAGYNWNPDFKALLYEFTLRIPESAYAGKFERLWTSMNTNTSKNFLSSFNKHSIKKWVEEVQPAKYKEIMSSNGREILTESVIKYSGILHDISISEVLHKIYSDKFVCFKNDKQLFWYTFVMPEDIIACKYQAYDVYKWSDKTNYISISNTIISKIRDYFDDIWKDLNISINAELGVMSRTDVKSNNPKKKRADVIIKNFAMTRCKIDSISYINSITKACEYIFYSESFKANLDKAPNLFGVANGVLELGSKITFHEKHNFAISKFTHAKYVDLPMSDPDVVFLMNLMRDIFIEPDVFDYMLYNAATGLDLNLSHGLLTLVVGGGSNGKSMFIKLVRSALGDSAMPIPFLLFQQCSQTSNSSNANSSAMALKGARWAFIDEGKEVAIDDYALKTFCSDNDSFSSRQIYQQQEVFKITSNIVIYSNHEVIITSKDHASWRRIVYYSCKTKFDENPDPNNKYEKKVQKEYANISEKSEIKTAMLSILCWYYKQLQIVYAGHLKNIFNVATTLQTETKQFRGRQDTLCRFITEMIEPTDNIYDLTADVIAAAYINWYAKYESKKIIPSIKKIRNEILDSSGLPFTTIEKISIVTGTEVKTIVRVLRGFHLKTDIYNRISD